MKRIGNWTTVVLVAYAALYAVARMTHILVMYNGCRGATGVDAADLGVAPKETVIMCAVARVAFWPLMQAETAVRRK
jgi:hypothetical protein